MNHRTFVVYEHLVIKRRDPTYKIWYHHGEEVCARDEIEDLYMFDTFNMYRSVYEREEVDNADLCSSSVYNELNQKMKNAKTHLYLECTKFTKMSAIIALYKLKVVSGLAK